MADALPSQSPPVPPPVVHLYNSCASCTTNSHTSNSTRSHTTIKLVHCKPDFTGKLDEDVETHLHRTNDWMHTHTCQEGVKVQCFCLTLVGEA